MSVSASWTRQFLIHGAVESAEHTSLAGLPISLNATGTDIEGKKMRLELDIAKRKT